MSAYNTTLLDEDGNEIYPKTLAENVYDGNVRMDQKVDGIRTDLGNPSSASAVTGADAFSKISKLNSDLASVVRYVDVTGTTTGNGNINLALNLNTGVVIAVRRTDTSDSICFPCPWNANSWGAHICSALAGMADIINTNVTVRAFYINSQYIKAD